MAKLFRCDYYSIRQVQDLCLKNGIQISRQAVLKWALASADEGAHKIGDCWWYEPQYVQARLTQAIERRDAARSRIAA